MARRKRIRLMSCSLRRVLESRTENDAWLNDMLTNLPENYQEALASLLTMKSARQRHDKAVMSTQAVTESEPP